MYIHDTRVLLKGNSYMYMYSEAAIRYWITLFQKNDGLSGRQLNTLVLMLMEKSFGFLVRCFNVNCKDPPFI